MQFDYSAQIKRIQEANTPSKNLVSGYIRDFESCVSHQSRTLSYCIPFSTINLCLMYYYSGDKWDANCIGKKCVVDENKNSVELNKFGNYRASAFLLNTVKPGEIYEWTFQLNHEDVMNENSPVSFDIGVYKHPINSPTDFNFAFFSEASISSYVFKAREGYLFDARETNYSFRRNKKKFKYGRKCSNNDVITMRLDLKRYTLSYIINTHHCSEFSIDRNEYKAAVYLTGRVSCINQLTLINSGFVNENFKVKITDKGIQRKKRKNKKRKQSASITNDVFLQYYTHIKKKRKISN